jgi:hypothetical protein
MIVDCEYHHMTERESLGYIRRQFGRRISRRTYYNYKNLVYQGPYRRIRSIPKWIRGMHLMGLQRDMERSPLGVV